MGGSLRALALAGLLLSVAVCGEMSQASAQAESWSSATLHRCHRHAHQRRPTWCIRLARTPGRPAPPPPPPPPGEETTVYDEEKRLVPTGPNPLHN